MKKKYIIICIIFVAFFITLFVIYKSRNIKLVGGTKSINNIVFSKSKITKKDRYYYFKSNIEAIDKCDISRVDIIIKNKNGVVIDTLEYKTDNLKPNKKEKINIKSNQDLSSANKVSFSVYK